MDAFIDPATGDYSVAAGSASRDPMGGVANAVYLRLMTPLGSYWADPLIGSRLHELQREKDKSRVATLAVQYAEVALKPILDDGDASDIQVTADREKDDSGAGRLLLSIQVTAGSERQTFTFPVKVI